MSDSESEVSIQEAPPVEPKVRKPPVKKERTPAQKEATAKALAILKERREAKAREEKERIEKASEAERQRILADKYEKRKQQKKSLPPAPSYLTVADMEKFRDEILGALPKEVYKAVEIPKVKKVPVEKPVEIRATSTAVAPKEREVVQLTGSALLDAILFKGK